MVRNTNRPKKSHRRHNNFEAFRKPKILSHRIYFINRNKIVKIYHGIRVNFFHDFWLSKGIPMYWLSNRHTAWSSYHSSTNTGFVRISIQWTLYIFNRMTSCTSHNLVIFKLYDGKILHCDRLLSTKTSNGSNCSKDHQKPIHHQILIIKYSFLVLDFQI